MRKRRTIDRSLKTIMCKRNAGEDGRSYIHANEWNELVPEDNRLESPNKNARRPASMIPTHIVIHITGNDCLKEVKDIYRARNSVSPHYLVTQTGELFQFVKDAERAWHSGIDLLTANLYGWGYNNWSKYLTYFAWYKDYPEGAVYLNEELSPVRMEQAKFVAMHDYQTWPDFSYFRRRWPRRDIPVNFNVDTDPNNYSIGIECLSLGAKTKNKHAYSAEMYKTLRSLVKNLCKKYTIPRKKGYVVGHEDVNPVGRWGWDPNSGFNWNRICQR